MNESTYEDRLLNLFRKTHGDLGPQTTLVAVETEDCVEGHKDGSLCWTITAVEMLVILATEDRSVDTQNNVVFVPTDEELVGFAKYAAFIGLDLVGPYMDLETGEFLEGHRNYGPDVILEYRKLCEDVD